MEDDYLNTDFDKAAEKLNQAIAKCGTDKCGVPVRSQLKRDLAAVQSAAGHKDLALAAMTEAFKIDAGLQLDPNFKTKELEAVYNEAKKAAASGGGSGGPPPEGDFKHTPVTEQQVRTPIPIYVEYSGSETLKRVMAKYKGLGMTEWKSLELKSIGSGYGATTPCADVQAGDFVYYIQGFNDQNDPVATGGDRNRPYKVNVKNEAVERPAAPARPVTPVAVRRKGDCPPDFPGLQEGGTANAAEDSSLKGEGESCEEDSECKSTTCKSQKCTAPPEEASSSQRKKFWIGVAGSLDLSFLSSSPGVCLLNPLTAAPVNGKGFYCTRNGTDFPAHNAQGAAENADISQTTEDNVGGGMVPGNFRILASFDYAFTSNQMVGLRAGYVVGTYPGTQAAHFPPIHAEARYTYVFGDDPIGKAGFHPFILAGTGVAPFDASVTVSVYEKPCGQVGVSAAACQPTVSAWQTGGPFFLETGGGARWEFVPGVAAMLDLKLIGAIGGSAGFKFIPAPELAVQFGF